MSLEGLITSLGFWEYFESTKNVAFIPKWVIRWNKYRLQASASITYSLIESLLLLRIGWISFALRVWTFYYFPSSLVCYLQVLSTARFMENRKCKINKPPELAAATET